MQLQKVLKEQGEPKLNILTYLNIFEALNSDC